MADPVFPGDGQTRFLLGLIGPAISASVGVFARHAQLVLDGGRWSWRRLMLEVPGIAGIAIASSGAAQWLHLGPASTSAIAAVAAWLGPKAVLTLVERRFGAKVVD